MAVKSLIPGGGIDEQIENLATEGVGGGRGGGYGGPGRAVKTKSIPLLPKPSVENRPVSDKYVYPDEILEFLRKHKINPTIEQSQNFSNTFGPSRSYYVRHKDNPALTLRVSDHEYGRGREADSYLHGLFPALETFIAKSGSSVPDIVKSNASQYRQERTSKTMAKIRSYINDARAKLEGLGLPQDSIKTIFSSEVPEKLSGVMRKSIGEKNQSHFDKTFSSAIKDLFQAKENTYFGLDAAKPNPSGGPHLRLTPQEILDEFYGGYAQGGSVRSKKRGFNYIKLNKIKGGQSVPAYRPKRAAKYRRKLEGYSNGGFIRPDHLIFDELFTGNPAEIMQQLEGGGKYPRTVTAVTRPVSKVSERDYDKAVDDFLLGKGEPPEFLKKAINALKDTKAPIKSAIDFLKSYKINGYGEFNKHLRENRGIPVTQKHFEMDQGLKRMMEPLQEDMEVYRVVDTPNRIMTRQYRFNEPSVLKEEPTKDLRKLEGGDMLASLGYTSTSKYGPIRAKGPAFKIQLYKGDPVIDVNKHLTDEFGPKFFNENEIIIPNNRRYMVTGKDKDMYELRHSSSANDEFPMAPHGYISGFLPLGLANLFNTRYNDNPQETYSQESVVKKRKGNER